MEIPADVTSISQSAFKEQNVPSFITKLTFAEGSKLERINACAFKNCSSLTSVDLLNTNISTIAVSAFEGCLELTSISFPSSLTTIDGIVFDNCPNLSSIIWNAWQGNTTVYSSSFSGVCQTGGTVTVTNPSGHDSDQLLQYLLDNGGLPSTWAKTDPLPENVYYIEDNVLKGFTSEFLANESAYSDYNTMLIPSSVTIVSQDAFYNTHEGTRIPQFIKNLTFAEGSNCSSIEPHAFLSCSSLTSITLPSSLKTIQSFAFLYCSSLNYISWDLPDGYETKISIGDNIFSDISTTGKVKSLNPSIASSQVLLNWIKEKTEAHTNWDNWSAVN